MVTGQQTTGLWNLIRPAIRATDVHGPAGEGVDCRSLYAATAVVTITVTVRLKTQSTDVISLISYCPNSRCLEWSFKITSQNLYAPLGKPIPTPTTLSVVVVVGVVVVGVVVVTCCCCCCCYLSCQRCVTMIVFDKFSTCSRVHRTESLSVISHTSTSSCFLILSVFICVCLSLCVSLCVTLYLHILSTLSLHM